MKVRFDRSALADMAGILDYIAERNPKAAVALRLRFEVASKLIGAFPEIASRTTRSNFRKMVIGKYLMVYEKTIDGGNDSFKHRRVRAGYIPSLPPAAPAR